MSIKDFYCMLFGEFNLYEFDLYLGEILSAEMADNTQLERRTAAYMVHVYLTEIRQETDEPSIEPAFVLKDIYECSSCIRHIAQVYLKGIMPAPNFIFGVRNRVEKDEAEYIAERARNIRKRLRNN